MEVFRRNMFNESIVHLFEESKKKGVEGFWTLRLATQAAYSLLRFTSQTNGVSAYYPLVQSKTPRAKARGVLLGGRGWIRTTEAESSRFTVCPLWPLGNSPKSDDNHYNTGIPLCQEKNHAFQKFFARRLQISLDGRGQTWYTVSVLNMLLWLSR